MNRFVVSFGVLIVVLISLLVGTPLAMAESTLTAVPPTAYVNEVELKIEDIEKISFYRNGEHYADVPATAPTLVVPDVCGTVIWTATATAGMESAHSDAVTQPIDSVGCVPKPPSAVSF